MNKTVNWKLRCPKYNINIDDCRNCKLYNPSDDSSIVCRRLIGNNKCWNLEGAYSIRQNNDGGYEIYYPLQKELGKMISTNEVIEILLKKYNLKVDRAVLRRYANLGLIEGKKISRGKGKGVQLYYQEAVLEKVFVIKQLLKENLKLEEISEYYQMFIQGVVSHIAVYGLQNDSINKSEYVLLDSNMEKYYRVMVYFLAIKAKIDFTKHNLSKMRFEFAFTHKPGDYVTTPPSSKKIIYKDGDETVGETTYK